MEVNIQIGQKAKKEDYGLPFLYHITTIVVKVKILRLKTRIDCKQIDKNNYFLFDFSFS